MKFQFIAQENQETGEIGWMDRRAEFPYEPFSSPQSLAHDCMEHFGMRTASDEIEAVGCIYWLRYESGYVAPSKYSRSINLDDLIADFSGNFDYFSRNDLELPMAEKQKLLDPSIEQDLEEIISKGKEMTKREFGEDIALGDNLEIYSERFSDYFRIGYRKAEKRYGKLGRHASCLMFTKLFHIFDKNKPEFEGQALTVFMNIKTGQVHYKESVIT
jgi:hypothetical protein